MSEEHERSSEFRTEHPSPAFPVRGQPAGSDHVNPYQAPAYHPGEVGFQEEAIDGPGASFWIASAVLLTLSFLSLGVAGGLALPLPFAVIGGIVRASVLFARWRKSRYSRSPAILLLFMSTFVTMLLMFCSAIAFVTICTGGVLAVGMESTSFGISWTIISGLAALLAFALMFVRSLKWGM